ncbi:MAG: amidohydrolase family protein [Sediminibacterium sp.]
MIIDADVHISPKPTGGNSITIDELLRRMDRAGVEKAVTWIQPPYWRHTEDSNRYVYEAAKAHPDRILPFGWADPNCGLQYALDEAKRCIEEYGFYGVKMNGAQNEFYIDDEDKAFPVIDYVHSTGKLMAFHIGGDSPEHTHPFRLGKIAARYPQMKILMVHMGGAHFHDLGNAAIETAAQHPNIHIIGSVIRSQPLLKAAKTIGTHRVCFGSDAPFELIHVEVAKYLSLFTGEISTNELNQIMGGNIAELFGLKKQNI